MEVAPPLVVRTNIQQNQQYRQLTIQRSNNTLNDNNSITPVVVSSTNNSQGADCTNNTRVVHLHHQHHINSHQRLSQSEQENINCDSPIERRVTSKSARGKLSNSTSGGGFSISTARRAQPVSRGSEFIAHQTSSNIKTNNNTCVSGKNSAENISTKSCNTSSGVKKSNSIDFQKTK